MKAKRDYSVPVDCVEQWRIEGEYYLVGFFLGGICLRRLTHYSGNITIMHAHGGPLELAKEGA